MSSGPERLADILARLPLAQCTMMHNIPQTLRSETMSETRDWTGWPFTLAQWGTDAEGKPNAWIVFASGTSGSVEERAKYEAWRDGPPISNDFAYAAGYPLPDPDNATLVQKGPYRTDVWWHGRILEGREGRRMAAVLAPGEFPDVDTSVWPPVYKPVVGTVPVSVPEDAAFADVPVSQPAVVLEPETVEYWRNARVRDAVASHDFKPLPAPTRRVPKVGDKVVVRLIRGLRSATVTHTTTNADGTTTNVVGYNWHEGTAYTDEVMTEWAEVVAWVD